MSPSQYNVKKEITSSTTIANNNNKNGLLPPLKINKDSHLIKKPSSSSPSLSSLSSTTSSLLVNNMVTSNKPPHQHQHPVIIYTHSPKVIHAHPKDFMALVQKLTGFSHSGDDDESLKSKHGSRSNISRLMEDKESGRNKMIMVRNEDNETTSMITKDNNCNNNIGESQVSCFEEPPILKVPMKPCLENLSVLSPNSTESMCLSQSWLNFSDSLFFSNNIRTSIPSPTTLESMKEFGDIYYS